MDPRPPNPAERRGIRRGIYVLPSLFTVGTLVCGYFAILSTLRAGQFLAAAGTGDIPLGGPDFLALAATALDNAARAIGWAIVFDGLDGRIARLTNTASPFGRELDSLADVITFGVAPAILAYVWGTRALEGITTSHHHFREFAWIITFAYVICGAARLARFNIDTVKPSSDRRFFVGMPIPAAAGFVAAVVHWFKAPVTSWTFASGWLVVVGILGFLMVSRMRYWSFKTLDLRKRRSYLTIIFIALIMGGIWLFSEPTLLIIAITYAVSGIVLRFIPKMRPRPPAPEEVHAA
ncbi:MAG TPA: CDP-diacylglycerol--serine O-phosphatidyltransferase [Terriglobia bacterium]|nr:CDP-diacylglycerol--serine O-phosphatidyltransferase [Terriglobia bacterium]